MAIILLISGLCIICYEKLFAECKYGAIFNCIGCHTKNYSSSVDVFDEKLEQAIREKFQTPDFMDKLTTSSFYITGSVPIPYLSLCKYLFN